MCGLKQVESNYKMQQFDVTRLQDNQKTDKLQLGALDQFLAEFGLNQRGYISQETQIMPSIRSIRPRRNAPPSTSYRTQPELPAVERPYLNNSISPFMRVQAAVYDYKKRNDKKLPRYIYMPDCEIRDYIIDIYNCIELELLVAEYPFSYCDGNEPTSIPIISDSTRRYPLPLHSVLCSAQ